MLITALVTIVCVAGCFALHFLALNTLAKHVYRTKPAIARPMLVVLLALFLTHLAEVVVYALGLSLLDYLGAGWIQGTVRTGAGWFADHFYFSIASYTTLGIGDIVPHGPLRMLVGIEALNGLVLIAWSASFTYLVMERLWGD